jgi:hypothetical protein
MNYIAVIQRTAAQKKKPMFPWVFSFFGGNGGIRTLDEALHPILP